MLRASHATTLAARLAPLWNSSNVSAESAVQAIYAIKKLARSESSHSESPVLSSNPQALLDRAYESKNFTKYLKTTEMQHAVFVAEPRPPVAQCVALLKQATPAAHWICLRTALQRLQFLDAFRIIDIYPQSLPMSIYPFAVGLASCTPWLPTPVSAVIAGCWIGLAIAAYSAPQFERVRWKSTVSFKYRILHTEQLKMANNLVEVYEDLTGASREPDNKLDRLITRALNQRGIEILPFKC